MQWSCLPVHSIFALEIKQNHFSFSVIGKFDLPSGAAEQAELDGQTTGGTNNNNFASLSSEEDGYHMDTPPTVSLVSDIQPCGIEIEVKSEPASLSSSSEKMVVSQTKSLSSASSDYKCLTESKSLEKNVLQVVDNLGADSSTDDQMSSGTFSQDEISPRFADLPPQLNVEKRRSLSTSDAVAVTEPPSQPARRSSSIKDKTLSMETRSTSIASDVSEQEIPPTTPRSDPTVSPESDAPGKFVYDGGNGGDSEMSSESQLSTTQTTQQTISSCEDSKVTKLVTEESTSVFESVIKMSENVTANILEETKTMTKSTKMEVEESVVSQKEVSSSSDKSEEMMAAATDSTDQVSLTVVSTESSVVTESSVTKTDSRTYSDVLKSDIYSESKLAATSTTTVDSKRSIGAEAASEVLKTETVLQLVGSSSAEERSKKLSYSDVVKSDSSAGKPEEKEPEDPIADWGKPLGLPSPIRPSTPAKQPKRNNEEPVDTNKVRCEV